MSREDATFNISRVAWLINALNSQDLSLLQYGMDDRLHQPQRAAALFPHLEPMIEAANAAGAHGCALSGAGSTVLAITSGRSGDIFTQHGRMQVVQEVADAMAAAAASVGVTGRVFIASPAERGAHVVKAEPSYSSHNVHRFQGGF